MARRIEIPDKLAAALAPYIKNNVFDRAAFERDCEDASRYLQQWDEQHPDELDWILGIGRPVEGQDNGA